jgi:hypothetical protein
MYNKYELMINGITTIQGKQFKESSSISFRNAVFFCVAVRKQSLLSFIACSDSNKHMMANDG